ncbi:DUF928 domain-containing protein [Pseudanabaena yagii]|uniref:DUF928 domain-containing protein n=1 Tax=Pseudanabaena yagii GIHE-NHR1 TaxID=2722753 RepID=A0ABX1LQY8_9CYAN|nr:DUF928 domain-containing protein [Pseudanabaena yagii]NMF57921.1 DUF928 domain-containing protein [Pseudanabaena yagii GIHE-NHR1]
MSLSKKILIASVCSCLAVTSNSIVSPLWFLNSEAQAQSRRVIYVPPSSLDSPLTSAAGARRTSKGEFIALTPQAEINIPPIPQTISERPTIYFRIPKFRGSVTFRLDKDKDAALSTQGKVYDKKFEINNDEGIIAFKLPDDAPILEVGQIYIWRMKFSSLDLNLNQFATIEGSVRRILPSKQLTEELSKSSKAIDRAASFAKEGIWFDMLQVLAEAQTTVPSNAEVRKAWVEILKVAFKNQSIQSSTNSTTIPAPMQTSTTPDQQNQKPPIQELVIKANFVLQQSGVTHSNY